MPAFEVEMCIRDRERTVEVVYESEPSSEEVVLDKLPLMDVIENGALLEALHKPNN